MSQTDPLDALDQFVKAAERVFAEVGYVPEARGRDWAHWAIKPFGGDVIRAYAFATPTERGIHLYVQGRMPPVHIEQLPAALGEATGLAWEIEA